MSAEGWTDQLIAVGNVHATAHGADREDRMDAGSAVLKMAERANRPEQLIASQDVTGRIAGFGWGATHSKYSRTHAGLHG